MTSEAVFIQVGALADGFAPHGNLLATASLPAGENFTFLCRRERAAAAGYRR